MDKHTKSNLKEHTVKHRSAENCKCACTAEWDLKSNKFTMFIYQDA